MEYLNSLKNLYALNDHKLNDLLQTIKNNIFPNTIKQVKSQYSRHLALQLPDTFTAFDCKLS